MRGLEGPLKKVWDLAEPLASTLGMELIWVEQISSKGRRTLKLTIDRPEKGVNIDDCAAFSRALDPILDMESEMSGRYSLEVSSPGLDRPLVRPKDFENLQDSILEIHTEETIQGSRHFKGLLVKAEKNGIILEIEGQNLEMPFENIRKARLDYFATEERNQHASKKKKNC